MVAKKFQQLLSAHWTTPHSGASAVSISSSTTSHPTSKSWVFDSGAFHTMTFDSTVLGKCSSLSLFFYLYSNCWWFSYDCAFTFLFQLRSFLFLMFCLFLIWKWIFCPSVKSLIMIVMLSSLPLVVLFMMDRPRSRLQLVVDSEDYMCFNTCIFHLPLVHALSILNLNKHFSKFRLWHYRLGHVCSSRLKYMSSTVHLVVFRVQHFWFLIALHVKLANFLLSFNKNMSTIT